VEFHNIYKKYIDNNKYDGEYKDNKRSDKGVFYWANGDKYEGEFKGALRYEK